MDKNQTEEPKTEEKPMNEGMYLEAMEQLQQKFTEYDRKRIIIENKNKMLAKELLTCYGMVRVIDSIINPDSTDFEVMLSVDVLRGYISRVVNESILDFTEEEFDN